MKLGKTLRRALAVALCGTMLIGTLGGCEQKKVSLKDEKILNFTEPEKGEKIVILTVKDYGDVTLRLFADECPKGVENFLGLVEQGFYDELIFHRVVKDFVIQGGDPKGDGTGGQSLWGNGFAQEISGNICHFTGALAYAVVSDKLNKSQFYVVTGDKVTDETFAQLKTSYGKEYSDNVKDLYKKYGGQPFLDGDYEVFGQVIGGLDICLAINDVAVNTSSKPKEQVQIEKMVVKEYDGSGITLPPETK